MKYHCNESAYPKDADLLKIVHYPDPILKKVATEVTEFGDELKALCQNMLLTMYHEPGIGLAAPQVGISKRIFVMDVDYKRDPLSDDEDNEEFDLSELNPLIFINPILKNKQGETTYQEGCLSLPGVFEDVKRSETLTIHYQDELGKEHSMEADDLLAICIQHENDHLDGIVFIDHLSNLKLNFYRKKLIKQKSFLAKNDE